MARTYLTLPVELEAVAESLALFLETKGYAVVAEPRGDRMPYRPALRARRAPTTIFVEVDTTIRLSRVREWTAYARASKSDTRVAVGIPASSRRRSHSESSLRKLGIGLYLVAATDVEVASPPGDLGLDRAPPTLEGRSRRVRTLLGPAYEAIDQTFWRDGFEQACAAVESVARTYILRDIKAGRVTFRTPGGRPFVYDDAKIMKMPLGALVGVFDSIATPNHTDSKVCAILRDVNPDRIAAAHKRHSTKGERRLRTNFNMNMWRIMDALEALLA